MLYLHCIKESVRETNSQYNNIQFDLIFNGLWSDLKIFDLMDNHFKCVYLLKLVSVGYKVNKLDLFQGYREGGGGRVLVVFTSSHNTVHFMR